ncbi:MAG: flagellar protein FlgN [Melioribacteraceae bacterium]|nr:MAG: flagellar protein FlgN [Melioribacteraceae bacterium]
MSIPNLIELLLKQRENLKRLLDNARKKQHALVANNRELLDECIKDEQKLILAVQNAENGRLQVIKEINREQGFEENEFRLAKLTANLGEVLTNEAKEAIIKSERAIRLFIEEITNTNNQNMFLIQHSKQFIDTTLKAVFGANNKSILDRKV